MKNNPNTLVDRLRDANRYLLPPTVGKRIGEAADRIEVLEAALREIAKYYIGPEHSGTYRRNLAKAALNQEKDQ